MNRVIKNLLKAFAGVAFAISICFMLSSAAYADGKVTVTVQSAFIRANASTSGTPIGSAMKNESLPVIDTEKDSAGYVWYKVKVNDNTTGYIRGDCVTAEGVSGTASTSTSTSTSTSVASTEPTYPTECNPVTGKVTADVRVRAGASTQHAIVTVAKNKSVVTVVGFAKDKSDKVWYQVSYSSDGKDISGYIRYDYVTLDGELTEKTPEPEPEPEPEPDPEPIVEPEPVYKDFEAVFNDSEGKWYLNNYIEGTKMAVDDLYAAVTNAETLKAEYEAKLKKKTVAIVILSLLIVVLLGGGAYAFFVVRGWYNGDEDDTEGFAHFGIKLPEKKKPAETTVKNTPSRSSSNVRVQTLGNDNRSNGNASSVRPQTLGNSTGASPAGAQIKGGGVRLPDGRIQMPDGSIRKAVVAVRLADGSIKYPDGTIKKPDGTIIPPEKAQGMVHTPEASRVGASSVSVREVAYNKSGDDSSDDDMEYGFLDLDGGQDE